MVTLQEPYKLAVLLKVFNRLGIDYQNGLVIMAGKIRQHAVNARQVRGEFKINAKKLLHQFLVDLGLLIQLLDCYQGVIAHSRRRPQLLGQRRDRRRAIVFGEAHLDKHGLTRSSPAALKARSSRIGGR